MDLIEKLRLLIDINRISDVYDYLFGIAVLIIFWGFKSIFATILIKIYYLLIKSKKQPKESRMYKPLKRFFELLGLFVMFEIFPMNNQAEYVVFKVFKLIAIYYLTRGITFFINPDNVLIKRLFKDPTNKTVNNFTCRIARAICWIIYIFIFISECGYNFSYMVTALGVGSAAVALAAQDLVKSLISGVSILTDKPFVLGDWIQVGEYSGTVIDITYRSIRIKSMNNSVITIPNSTVTSTYVINWNRLTSRRFDITLNISLETPAEKIKYLVRSLTVMLQNNPNAIKETVQVNFIQLAACSADIRVFLYVKEADYLKYLKVQQGLLCDIKDLLDAENIELAYPTQTIHIRKEQEV